MRLIYFLIHALRILILTAVLIVWGGDARGNSNYQWNNPGGRSLPSYDGP